MESMLAEELDERFVVGEVERNVRTLKAPMFGDDGKVSGVLGILGTSPSGIAPKENWLSSRPC